MTKFDALRDQLEVEGVLEGVQRYNPNNLKEYLNEFVEVQAEENRYHVEANLTVLKLYQLNPDKFDVEIVRKILLKSLMALPSSDFVLTKCLLELPKKDPNAAVEDVILHRESKIHDVLLLGDMIEACDFAAMWEYLNANPALIEGVKGFEEAVRNFICHTVNITFQNIEKSLLVALLGNISERGLVEYVNQYKWRMEGDSVFIQNHEATVKSKNIEEKIEFSHIKDILRSDGRA